MLVEACMEEARELNIAKVFLLTYQEEFLGSVDLHLLIKRIATKNMVRLYSLPKIS